MLGAEGDRMGTAGHLEKDRHVRELKARLRREEEY